MIHQIKQPAYTCQLLNEQTSSVDFIMDYYDSGLVNTSFSANTFSKYEHYTIIWLYNGQGRFQVDFQHYDFTGAKMIFLTPGQYFNVEKGRFNLIRYAFSRDFFCVKEQNSETLCNGVLYNHLYAVASIEIKKQEEAFLEKVHDKIVDAFLNPFVADRKIITEQLSNLLSFAVHTWQNQQPLSPDLTEKETKLLFELKKAVDQNYKTQLSIEAYASKLNISEKKLARLIKSRIGLNITDLISKRQLLEAKRDLYFTNKAVKEIAMELGFNDPAYFNRFFKKHTKYTPVAFRKIHGIKHWNESVKLLADLIDLHYKTQRNVGFYASELHLTPRTLSDMVKRVLNKTVSELIQLRLILEAKRLLYFSEKVIKEIAFDLGFDDPAYFSYFFKNATAASPEEFRDHWRFTERQNPTVLHREFGLFNWMWKTI